MALKIKITKDDFEGLSDVLKSEYTEAADGSYSLAVDGLEDTGALKRAKDHEKAQRQSAETKARELADQIATLQGELDGIKNKGARDKGDIDALEKSYQQKMAELNNNHTEAVGSLHQIIQRQTVEAAVQNIAAKLCGDNADIIAPHIRQKLKVDISEGDAHLRVLNDSGEVTADTLEDLHNNFFTSERFAPIVIGSKASGGGAAGRSGKGGGAAKSLKDMSPDEEAKFAKEQPDRYQEMVAAEG